MNVTIRPATLRDMTFITANIRPQDRQEIEATAAVNNMTEAAFVSFHGSDGWCWCAWLNDQPVGAFGVSGWGNYYQPHLRHGWAYGTRQFKRAVPAISRFMMGTMVPLLLGEGITRIEVRSLEGHDLAHKWLAGLKCRHEAVMPNYGVHGETFHLWAWVKEDFV